MPRYVFACRACRLEFEVSRPMSEAGRPATCPLDGAPAGRVFTAPLTSVRQGDAAAPPPAAPPSGAVRDWSSPFFPKGVAPPAPAGPRHVLPAGSSRPTRFRHFGHWHPAGTPPHSHAPRRAAPPPAEPEA